jgi:hypothetical protein
MRKFFVNLFYFSIVPLFIFGSIEICICTLKTRLFSENNLEKIYKNDAYDYDWIKSLKGDSLTVLAGSSSVRYGLSCKILNEMSPNNNKYVNIAMDARDPIQTYFIIKNLGIKNISAIYFGLDPWIYAKRYYMHRNSYLYLDFSFFEFLNFSKEHDKSSFIKRYKSFFKYLFTNEQHTIYNENFTTPIDFGSVVLKGKAVNFNQPINESFQLDKYGWSDLQFEYLKKISELCKEKNIKFAVFIPPKRSDYSKVYKEKCNLIHDEYLKKLVNVGFNSSIFGVFDQLDKMGNEDNFTEAYHLNKKGQDLYSKIFYELTTKQMSSFSKSYDWFTKDNNKAHGGNKGYMQ